MVTGLGWFGTIWSNLIWGELSAKDFDEFCALLTKMLGADGKIDKERMLQSTWDELRVFASLCFYDFLCMQCMQLCWWRANPLRACSSAMQKPRYVWQPILWRQNTQSRGDSNPAHYRIAATQGAFIDQRGLVHLVRLDSRAHPLLVVIGDWLDEKWWEW